MIDKDGYWVRYHPSLQVAFAKNVCVVRDMAGDDVGKDANRERVVARNAGAQPGFGSEIAEERESAETDAAKVVNMAAPGKLICFSNRRADVLIVTGQGRIETPGKPEGAEKENAFSIVDMIQQLAN